MRDPKFGWTGEMGVNKDGDAGSKWTKKALQAKRSFAFIINVI